MNTYSIVAEIIEALKRNNKINPLNVRKIIDIEQDDSILLVCDTDDGNITSVEPWIGFKVFIPREAFISNNLPMDEVANIPQSTSIPTRIRARIAYYIFEAYKKAKEIIFNN